jgi:hypothetical protein
MCFTLRLHTSAAPPRVGLTQALGRSETPAALQLSFGALMFWLSIVLAILIGGFTLFNVTVGGGLQLVALILAGNAFVRLQHGKPNKTRANLVATWVAIATSGLGLVLGLYRAVQ